MAAPTFREFEHSLEAHIKKSGLAPKAIDVVLTVDQDLAAPEKQTLERGLRAVAERTLSKFASRAEPKAKKSQNASVLRREAAQQDMAGGGNQRHNPVLTNRDGLSPAVIKESVTVQIETNDNTQKDKNALLHKYRAKCSIKFAAPAPSQKEEKKLKQTFSIDIPRRLTPF